MDGSRATRVIYTPAYLSSLIAMRESVGWGCTVPGCDAERSEGSRSPWGACSFHNQLISMALYQARRRRVAVVTHSGIPLPDSMKRDAEGRPATSSSRLIKHGAYIMCREDLEWLRHTAQRLSKICQRRVSMSELIRLALDQLRGRTTEELLDLREKASPPMPWRDVRVTPSLPKKKDLRRGARRMTNAVHREEASR